MLRKLRSNVDDIVLTSDDFHISHYEAFLRENGLDVEIYVKQFMKSLVELIEMKDQNGNFLVIEEKHMREVLYKNFGESAGEQVLAGWNPNDPSFTVRLNEFNNRRERAYKGEYNTYLIDKYNNAYSAYFQIVKGITYTEILATQNDLDFLSMIYDIPFTLRPIQMKY